VNSQTKDSKAKQENKKQSERFIEAARKAEADETEAAADQAFKRVARSKAVKKTRK
jgi:hypothetical protein